MRVHECRHAYEHEEGLQRATCSGTYQDVECFGNDVVCILDGISEPALKLLTTHAFCWVCLLSDKVSFMVFGVSKVNLDSLKN